MKDRLNMAEFATIAGLILDQAAEQHPIRVSITSEPIMQTLKVEHPMQLLESGRMFKEVFAATLQWLMQEGFIDSSGHVPGQRVCLTTKALAALNAMPANLNGKSIGDSISNAKSEDDAGERQNKIATFFGDFIGSAAGSFTKSIGTGS
jgi:hypothetical protein